MKNILGEQASPNPDYPQEITNVTGDVEVKVQNKNLLNIETLLGGSLSIAGLYLNGGYSYFNITDNKVTVTTTQNYRGFVSDYIEIKENTRYFLSFETLQTGLNFEKYYSFYDENKENGSRNQTGLSPANAKYMRVSGTISTATTADFYNIQVEEGSVATDYIKHKSQTFTFPLGNEKLMLGDYLADDGIHHVRKQVVLDGSDDEDWFKNWEEDENHRVFMANNFLPDSKRFPSPTTNILCKSNYFKAVCYDAGNESIWRLKGNDNYPNLIAINDNEKSASVGTVVIKYDASSDINEFKTWLSTHNTIVEYELAEEVIVPYTSAQQEVYNQIKQTISYEEQTNISSNTIALFNVEAYQSTKLVLEEMATAIVALGGV